MAASYRPITAATYEDAQRQLQPGETLVSANQGQGNNPQKGNIPVTSDRSFRVETGGGHKVYARKD